MSHATSPPQDAGHHPAPSPRRRHRPSRTALASAAIGSLGGLTLFADLSLHVFGSLDRSYFVLATIMAICLLGVPALYWQRDSFATGWQRAVGMIGAGLVALGVAAWVTAFVILFTDPGAAFTQRLTPAGSLLMALGMTMLGTAVLASRHLQGLRTVAPLAVGLYFAAQLAFQLVFFLGGRDATPGPNGLLLGAWGLVWVWSAWAGATAVSRPAQPPSSSS